MEQKQVRLRDFIAKANLPAASLPELPHVRSADAGNPTSPVKRVRLGHPSSSTASRASREISAQDCLSALIEIVWEDSVYLSLSLKAKLSMIAVGLQVSVDKVQPLKAQILEFVTHRTDGRARA